MKHVIITALLILMATTPSFSQIDPFRLSLDGEWSFKVDQLKSGLNGKWYSDSVNRADWQHVAVPAFWEGYPGLANYDGWGWFARTVKLEKQARPISMHFAGVDDDAVVWINGVEVGSHSGYTDPFAFDVTGTLHAGDNTIVVLVKDYGGGGGIYRPITIIETAHLDDLLKSEYFGRPALKSADWVKDAVIYSVYLRSFSREGTFAGLEARVPELKNLGVSVLWLLPINPVGVKNRKGSLGSPYAVQDYYGINPEFGTMDDFKRLLNTVHKNGMKLIIDLVANHTSWDSKLMHDHPDWFTRDATGRIVAPNADWTDVADLNYSKPGLRAYMIEMMRWWMKDVGIDGFRCDVAELVPTDFWNEARTQLNRIKPIMMLSEGSIPEHHVKAFDLTYSWNIYDALDPLLKGKRPAVLLDQILKTESLQFPSGSLRMRFVTNHDKNAWDAPAVTKFGPDGLKLAVVLTNTLPGVPMIYTGEEVANDRKLSLFEKVSVDWKRPRTMESLYRTMFQLRKEHKALSRGEMFKVASSEDSTIYSFFRVAGNDRILAILNFGPVPSRVTLRLPLERLMPGAKRVDLKEVFSGKSVRIDPSVGREMEVDLEGRGYRVYVVR